MKQPKLLSGVLGALLLSAGALAVSACNRPVPPPQVPADNAAQNTVVAMIGDKPVTMADVDKAAGRQLYEVREQALDRLVMERVVQPEAQKAGLPVQRFLSQLVEKRVPQISEAEAEAWFNKNPGRLPPQLQGKKFAEIKDVIVQGLTEQKRSEAFPAILEEMKARAGVKILLAPPKVQVAAEGPSRGPATAKVTVVEFSDFQCPYCSRGRQVMDEVVKAYGDKVRVVFRDFPLDFHQNAQKAAEAGHCADEQGKFWQMHDWMFEHQDKLGVDDLKAGARGLGIEGEKFDKCLTEGKHAQKVAANMQAGREAGVQGTPAFFVNGVFINGAQPFEKFKAEIDRALAQ